MRLKNLVIYAVHVLIVRPVLFGIVGVRYRRRSALPKGPCLVVANHNSHLDAAVLMTMFPLSRIPEVHPVAAADYFSANWFMKMWAMLFLNAIPFDRKPARGRDPLAPVIEQLRRGQTLIFFPEGSRGEAGVVSRFRSGVGLIVQALPGLLVVPVFLSGPERIWPRGRVIPVPLNIDANIGKPRTYPSDRDPREIADLVRHDVLALAPPPPALPGAGRARPPLRVAVCSSDAEERATLHRCIAERLGQMGKTLAISGADWHELPGRVSGPRRVWLRLAGALARTRGRFRGEGFVDLVERSRVDEALEHVRDARFAVTEGSPLIDFAAWSQAELRPGALDEREIARLLQYLLGEKALPPSCWWRFVRHAPQVWLVNVLHLARPAVPDVVVLLRPPVARLQQAYEHTATLLRNSFHVETIEADAATTPAALVAERVAESCRERLEPTRTA